MTPFGSGFWFRVLILIPNLIPILAFVPDQTRGDTSVRLRTGTVRNPA